MDLRIKKCNKCKINKDLGDFSKGKNGKFGVRGSCKLCEGKSYKLWARGNGKSKIAACNDRFYKKARFTDSYRYIRYKASAKQRGFDFRISRELCFSLFNGICLYCGTNGGKLGIDRIDSDIGYLKENVVACCAICNIMKNDMKLDDFIEQCEKITQWYSLHLKK